jgi:pimeloyl-ACP methyl ester carboxylesterase
VAEEGYIDVADGARLFFRSVGSGDAVIIPLACWTEEFDVLADGRRLIFYDPRNRGGSTAVDLPHISFQNDVDDLEAIRAHLALDRVALIGWSYFAAVVARYAMEYPRRVSRFVMVCGQPIRRLPYADAITRMMGERLEAVAPGFLQQTQRAAEYDPALMRRFWDLLQQVRTGRQPPSPMRSNPARYGNEHPEKVAAVFTRALQTQGDWDWREDARRVTSPALYVFGTADIMPLEAVQEWTECLPDARILTLDGVGHHPAVEDPERFFPALDTFLSGQWPEGAARQLM